MRGERGDDSVLRGAGRSRAIETEERRQLAEVATDTEPLHYLLPTTGALAGQLDLARLDDVRNVTRLTLREQELSGLQLDALRFAMHLMTAGRQLDNLVR